MNPEEFVKEAEGLASNGFNWGSRRERFQIVIKRIQCDPNNLRLTDVEEAMDLLSYATMSLEDNRRQIDLLSKARRELA
jgi:hypothetical protein